MKKYYCPVCGYESDEKIDVCPICKAKMKEREEGAGMTWAAEHILGVGKEANVPEEIIMGLRDNFNGECSERRTYPLCRELDLCTCCAEGKGDNREVKGPDTLDQR